MTTKAKFRVGDVVRLRRPTVRWSSLDISRCSALELRSPCLTIPAGCEGVVKEITWLPHSTAIGEWLYGISIPEGRCYCFSTVRWLEFIEHQPSPEEIAAMYAAVQ